MLPLLKHVFTQLFRVIHISYKPHMRSLVTLYVCQARHNGGALKAPVIIHKKRVAL